MSREIFFIGSYYSTVSTAIGKRWIIARAELCKALPLSLLIHKFIGVGSTCPGASLLERTVDTVRQIGGSVGG